MWWLWEEMGKGRVGLHTIRAWVLGDQLAAPVLAAAAKVVGLPALMRARTAAQWFRRPRGGEIARGASRAAGTAQPGREARGAPQGERGGTLRAIRPCGNTYTY